MDDTTPITMESVHAWAAGRLARSMLPRRLTIVPAVPRNASGKLGKVVVRWHAGGAS
ncbi:hypothetical protein [Streptomyces sp. BK340]|uniref:hypothetical protein n=1 Tax=Streptomyces sp. BK340 TaxID=2572903 RepID=UPI0021BD69A7|nr:hypothetical protein [Streptomyces sp. BK340]